MRRGEKELSLSSSHRPFRRHVVIACNSGDIARAMRAQGSTMGKKIWLSMHPKNFGSEKIVHAHIHTSTHSSKPWWNFALQATARFGGKSHGHPNFQREKKTTTKPSLSFDWILMSTLTWITEKELERDIKKQRRPISLEEKHENFIAAVRKWEMLAATKLKMSAIEKKKRERTGTHTTFPP